ncbi:hypothetical protein FRUB_03698 [Fimbriiglobus ruber]|uniref:DNA mimic protein DMP19 C-terminal domain-containing protein n=1 Tax=Fimbriiglobus ruber TaxID=1908690 RepID=A0A225DJI2_9BACT|nr:hypothetical protein FRUB_03698 [Fimbriiglobus ruber]
MLSVAEFDAIPADDEYPIDGYYETLIDRNERITHEVYEQPERLKELTAGQRMLIQLGTFDSQVKNGGVTQFFWNCTEHIFDVADWIEQLTLPELQANYDRALEALVGKKDRWLELRAEWIQGRDNPNWVSFRQTYELLELGWFDKTYFDKHGYNERQEWVQQSRGFHHTLLTRLAGYVCVHRTEFVTE